MDYKIDDVDQVTDWLSSFEALSTVQFEKFSRRLYFPVQISPDLREVAKQFCLAVLNHRTNFNSEYPPPELPVDPLFVPSENIDPLIQIWMNTFSHLKTVGYDEIVYRGGKKIQQSEVISTPVSGSQWFGLLQGWAEDGF
ncbi:MAG TPA: hypothetical protein VHL11_15185, partial [Phototrophicaceae bacterium]|nr:hypothetical protein [Phototrophicaceae bacterium]